MAFTTKDWQDFPSQATSITAAALEDLETRVTSYAARFGVDGATGADTTAIQGAIDAAAAAGGGCVQLQAGTYVVNGLTLKSLVTIQGKGQYATTIKLANGANTTLVKGDGFDALTGNNSNNGIYGAGIRDLTLDGNKANNATGGNGISIYGYDNHFENLRVTGCKGKGIFHEWGATAAVNSDTLATGSMDCHSYNLRIDRNEGGGIDWYGPSDSIFVSANIAKNGPASGTTTVGVIIRGNAFTCQFTNVHVWGVQHQYGWRLDQATMLAACSAEGATGGNVWLRAGGSQLTGLKLYTGGATVPYGLIIGDSAASLFSGDNVVDAKFKDCGIQFQKDSGGGTYKCSYYWGDSSKTFITNTNPQNATRPNIWDISQGPVDGPPAKIGTTNAIARVNASILDAQALVGSSWAVNGGFTQNIPRWACDKDQGSLISTGKMYVSGGLAVLAGQTVSSVSFFVGATAYASTAGSHLWAAMWDADTLALLAQSTDDTTGTGAMPANALKTFTFATPYTPLVTKRVYVGVMAAGSSGFAAPSFWGSFVGNAYMASESPGVSWMPATSGLTTTAPDPLSLASATASTKIIYCSLA